MVDMRTYIYLVERKGGRGKVIALSVTLYCVQDECDYSVQCSAPPSFLWICGSVDIPPR